MAAVLAVWSLAVAAGCTGTAAIFAGTAAVLVCFGRFEYKRLRG